MKVASLVGLGPAGAPEPRSPGLGWSFLNRVPSGRVPEPPRSSLNAALVPPEALHSPGVRRELYWGMKDVGDRKYIWVGMVGVPVWAAGSLTPFPTSDLGQRGQQTDPDLVSGTFPLTSLSPSPAPKPRGHFPDPKMDPDLMIRPHPAVGPNSP